MESFGKNPKWPDKALPMATANVDMKAVVRRYVLLFSVEEQGTAI